MISNAVFLYLGTLRAPITNAVPPSYLESDLTASAGLLLLGPALVVLGFILRTRQHVLHTSAVVPASQPARRVSPRAMQYGIVGCGTLVTVLVTIFLLTTTLPRLIQTSENQQYTAAIPGPDCDSEGATWSVTPSEPISTSCLQKTGLQVMVQAKSTGMIEFTPPSGVFTQNYRVSVKADLSHLSNGCVSIETHFTSTGYYLNDTCNNGLWGIRRIIGNSDTLLAANNLVRATTYTIEATTDGANQRLAINGMEVGSVSDTTIATTKHVNLGIANLSGKAGSVIFSNFVFTPLPALPPASPQTTYRASTTGVACDKGGAQWALMTPLEAKVECQPNGTQLEVQARNEGLMVFTPPGGIFPQNYRVSVQVDFGSLSNGCILVVTHALATNGYQNTFCADRSWYIEREDKSATLLTLGHVAPAKAYTIEVTADGTNQRLAINGVEVGTVSDTAFSTTGFISLAELNHSDTVGKGVFSNFVFTSLPALPPASPQTTYRASTPGVACDKGGAQWALMTPQVVNSSVECQPTSMLFQLPGRSLGREAFTPPSGLFPQNYQVSVQVNLSTLREGCMAIEERTSGENYYQLGSYYYILCRGGAWSMNVENGNTPSLLASGRVAPANMYTLEASAQGPHLWFTINGVKVGSVSNSKFTATALIGLDFSNISNNAGAVLFSNFIFTALP